MFPLGSVLLPGGSMRLRVFEPRYRTMIDRIWPGEPEFGVVLIDRGPEVGGGDRRTSIGCRAEIIDLGRDPTDQISLDVRGTVRIVATEWLDDDPYPRAVVEDHPDPPADGHDPVHGHLIDAFGDLMELLGGGRASARPWSDELAPDPVTRGYQIADALPLGPLDAHHVLAAADAQQRAALLIEAIGGFDAVIRSSGDR